MLLAVSYNFRCVYTSASREDFGSYAPYLKEICTYLDEKTSSSVFRNSRDDATSLTFTNLANTLLLFPITYRALEMLGVSLCLIIYEFLKKLHRYTPRKHHLLAVVSSHPLLKVPSRFSSQCVFTCFVHSSFCLSAQTAVDVLEQTGHLNVMKMWTKQKAITVLVPFWWHEWI